MKIISWKRISSDTLIALGRNCVESAEMIVLSVDGGTNWRILANSFNETEVLAVSQNKTLFAGTEYSGAFMSTDFGDAWEPVIGIANMKSINIMDSLLVYINSTLDGFYSVTLPEKKITGIKFPIDPNITNVITKPSGIIIVGGYSEHRNIPVSGGLLSVPYGGGLWRSVDYGNTWKMIILDSVYSTPDNGKTWLANDPYRKIIDTTDQPEISVHSLGTGPEGEILAVIDVGTRTYLITSRDDGNSWEILKTVDRYDYPETNFMISQKGDIFIGLKRSMDGGKTYQEITNGLRTKKFNKLVLLPAGDAIAATQAGLCYLPYHGNTWHTIAFDNIEVRTAVLLENLLFASIYYDEYERENECDLYRIHLDKLLTELPEEMNETDVWTKLDIHIPENYHVYKLLYYGLTWCIRNDYQALARSEDGNKWTFIPLPVREMNLSSELDAIEIDLVNNCVWMADGSDSYKMDMSSGDWTKIIIDTVQKVENFMEYNTRFFPDTGGTVYAAVNSGYSSYDSAKVYVTRDTGKSWHALYDFTSSVNYLFRGAGGKLFAALEGNGLACSD